jgi:CBS domain-containing protein
VSFHLSLSSDRVTDAFPKQPLAVSPTETVGAVLRQMRTHSCGSVLVVGPEGSGREDLLDGIFTERDALHWLAAQKPLETPISEAMTRAPYHVTANTTVGEAIEQMSNRGYRHLPIVTSTGQPLAVAGVHGIVQYLVDHFPETIYTLPPEPDRSPAHREGA